MRYVRFLQTPRYDESTKTIKCLVALTSDLGETFLETDMDLVVLIRYADNDDAVSPLGQRFTWRGSTGMRCLRIAFAPTKDMLNAPHGITIAVAAVPPDELPNADDDDAAAAAAVLRARTSSTALPCGVRDDFPLLVAAQSGTFAVRKGRSAESECCRSFRLVNDVTLSVWERAGDSIEGHLWDAGFALLGHLNRLRASSLLRRTASSSLSSSSPTKTPFTSNQVKREERRNQIQQRREPRHGVTVLELGCGTGAVGLCLAQLVPRCKVVLTDLPSAAELVARNIAANRLVGRSTLQFVPLEWGGDDMPVEIERERFDLVFATDCTYNPDYAVPLIQTFGALQARSPDVLLVVASKKRHDSEDNFVNLMIEAQWMPQKRFSITLPTDWNREPLANKGDDSLESPDVVNVTCWSKASENESDGKLQKSEWVRDHILGGLW